MIAGDELSVVLVHGYLDNASIWGAVGTQLAAHGIPILVPTYGLSSEDSLDEFADEIVAAVRRDGRARTVLVGQSMGAPIAELAARKLGAQAAGLVLVSPIPLEGLRLPAEVAGPLRGCAEDADAQRKLRQQLSVDMPPADVEALVANGVRIPARRVEALFDAWSGGDAVAAQTRPPAIPTLVVSSDDPFVNDDVLTLVLQRHQDAQRAHIDGAGHWPHVEKPAAVSVLIETFYDSLRAPTADGDGDGDGDEVFWTAAFTERKSSAFAAGLADDVELQASTLIRPVVGRDAVAAVMEEASKMYATLTFTRQAEADGCRWLAWRAVTHSGLNLEGVTLLESNADGLIERASIHHRPLAGALAFSAEIGDRLNGVIPRDYFWSGTA